MEKDEADFPERRLIAFVSRAEKLGESNYSRTSYEFDGFDADCNPDKVDAILKGSEIKPFGLVRIVTTQACFKRNFDFVPEEGAWIEVQLRKRDHRSGPIAFHSQLQETGYRTYTRGALESASLLFPPGEEPRAPSPVGATVTRARQVAAKIVQASRFPMQAIAAKKNIRNVLWKLKAAREVQVRDVGQASFATLISGSGSTLAHFDAGWPISFNRRTEPKVSPNVKVAPVILSHWDWDHLHGYYKFPALQNATWIAPVQNLGPGAARIANRLANAGRLKAVVHKSILFAWGELSVCDGPNAPNDTGLALLLFLTGSECALFIGDANYDAYDGAGSILPLNMLVVTHHGARFSGSVPTPIGSKASALVSVGRGNVYKHPHQPSLDRHTALNWNVELTSGKPGKQRGDRFFPT